MKNFKITALSILAAGSLVSCTGGAIQAKLNSQADSISYAIGVSQFSPEIRSMVIQQFDNDSTVISDIISGVEYGRKNTAAKSRAYQMGVSMGQGLSTDMIKQMNQMFTGDEDAKIFKPSIMINAIIGALEGKEPAMDAETANAYFTSNQTTFSEEYAAAKEAGTLNDPAFEAKADSICFALAAMQFPSNIGEMVIQQFDNDTNVIADIIKGIEFGQKHVATKDKAYSMGVGMGQGISTDMIKQMNISMLGDEDAQILSADNILSALITVLKGEKTLMTVEEANEYMNTALPALKEEINEKKYGDYKTENVKFLEENAKSEGVFTTESGLQYRILTEGKGDVCKEGQEAVVHYEGSLIDNTVFDSSYQRGEPATFSPNRVVGGFKEALLMMPAGSIWEVYIPQELGYGASDMGQIKPYSTLIFKIEVLEFKD